MSTATNTLFLKKVPLYIVLLFALISGMIVYVIQRIYNDSIPSEQTETVTACEPGLTQLRGESKSLVHPLFLVDVEQESHKLASIKLELQSYINNLKDGQKVTDVSVYFRRLNDGACFTINPTQVYNPASLIKVAFMITYLKDAETQPGLLDRKLHFGSHSENYAQNIKSFRLKENQDYSIRDLLTYMIRYSDNESTVLLQNHANANTFMQLFNDLKVPLPDFSKEYFITSVDMAKFFRILYNGTYLNKPGSELALKLLSSSDYDKGIIGGFEQPLTVAHKFGERVIGNTAQLHEFGIVYSGNQPYLLGVMTSGSNLDELSEVVKTISRKSFEQYRVFAGI